MSGFVPRVHDLRFGWFVRPDADGYAVVGRDTGAVVAVHPTERAAAVDALRRDGDAKLALIERLTRTTTTGETR